MVLLVSLLAFASLGLAQNFTNKCQGFNISMANVTVNTIQFVPNGTNLTFPNTDPTCTIFSQVVYGGDICRLSMNVSTSNSSGFVFEAWMPSTWNGRFLSVGNGGLGGCISYDDIAYANSYGFAAVGSNNGHNGNKGSPFLNAPQVQADFAYRAIHRGVLVGKNLTQQFYGTAANRSYYLGCSTGGRQGWKEAQAYPEDFDGIVAGAPAFDWNHLQAFSSWLSNVSGYDNTSSTFITAPLWNVINTEVLRQCDGLDGAVDGIIEDPTLCTPTFERLLCAQNATNTSACLNPAQYNRAVLAFSPLYNASGTLIYPRMQPGASVGNIPFFYSGQPFAYSTDWFKYVVYSNASWNASALSQADFTAIDRDDVFNISTFNGNISAFANRGGKILHYHGLQDQVISSSNSARYYSHLASTMGLPPSAIDSFYRYFRISGMGHCSGGPGAYDIGQKNFLRPAGTTNSNNNVLNAIMAWVEQGQAPDYIEGFRWVNGTGNTGLKFKRKHCKYPARNVYKGTGNGTDEDGWMCV